MVLRPQAEGIYHRNLLLRQTKNNVDLHGQVQRIDRFQQTHGRSLEMQRVRPFLRKK